MARVPRRQRGYQSSGAAEVIAVDARMAEGFVTLLGSVGVTIYQVVLGGSKPY